MKPETAKAFAFAAVSLGGLWIVAKTFVQGLYDKQERGR